MTPGTGAPAHPSSSETRLERLLLLLAAGLGAWLVVSMPVFAQEAYYWSYAEHLDWSYFDHPPVVAWFIWLGTKLCGDGVIGIRLGTWLCGTVGLLAGRRLLLRFGAPPVARIAWLLLASCVPSLLAIRFLANPDPPLACFWVLTLLALWDTRSGSLRSWILAGFFAGCALLSKYTAAFLAIGGVAVLLLDPAMRRQIAKPGPWLGVAVAALTFAPVVLWNYGHDFESFRFQTTSRWEHATVGGRWFLQLVLGQLVVLNPVLVGTLPLVLGWLVVRAFRKDLRALWLLAFSAPLVLFLLGNALFVQVKINWFAPVVAPLALGACLWWGESAFRSSHPRLAWLVPRAALLVPFFVLLAPAIRLLPQTSGTSWNGWTEIAVCAEKWEEEIDLEDGVEGNVFFFAADYRDASQLAHALKQVTQEEATVHDLEPVLAQNVLGLAALNFDHWTPPKSRIGQDAIFVLPRPAGRGKMLSMVEARFAKVQLAETVRVAHLGIPVAEAEVYLCRNYRGPIATR